MAPTPLSKLKTAHQSKTPQSKLRLNFSKETASTTTTAVPAEHPVEVIGRIRNNPDQKDKSLPTQSTVQINSAHNSLRLKTDIGYRDFTLDGVSLSEEDDLDGFYRKFVESRIKGVKMGNKCTVMMYGPTGSGKSHTMFGCAKQPGIVYRSLRDILGGEEEMDGDKIGVGRFVQVSVLEIYNEEIYDLLPSANSGGRFGLGWSKGGSASKVKLEVMGKKAKNASFISGNEAGKILKEIEKVEKRRIVKSTLCNERSSRSHCMIILDVPTVGGRLMLVDMAGSENIEQAGQNGMEAKMQTAKINQGNTALKRVVESIANGDSHVPFRDSKLTMLLQDSFEDDKSKILMILCASPGLKELHKTIATLEYGAKAKCIVRGPHTPIKEKGAEDSSSAVILGSRIEAMDQFIYTLQMESRLREKERNEAQKELKKKEEEISGLRTKLAIVDGGRTRISEDEIDSKVNERAQILKSELERKIKECQKIANDILEKERRKMEEKIFQQQQEVEMLRRRLEEIESELSSSRAESALSADIEESSFIKRFLEVSSEDSEMVKSMDLDKSLDMGIIKYDDVVHKAENNSITAISGYSDTNNSNEDLSNFTNKTWLSTVYEEEEEEESEENLLDEEVQKEVIDEEKTYLSALVLPEFSCENPEKDDTVELVRFELYSKAQNDNNATSREMRIQNIFTLCGDQREQSQHETPTPVRKKLDLSSSPSKSVEHLGKISRYTEIGKDSKENHNPLDDDEETSGDLEVYVKWEASKENAGNFITALKVLKDSTLADLRKLIEIYLGGEEQAFTFLVLGDDPSSCPVSREKEAATQTSKLPICNNQLLHGHLACLRPAMPNQCHSHLPFSPLENKLSAATPRSQQCDLPAKPNQCHSHLPFSPLENKLSAATPRSQQCDLPFHLN